MFFPPTSPCRNCEKSIRLFGREYRPFFNSIVHLKYFCCLSKDTLKNLIFACYTGSKNQVWNRQKIWWSSLDKINDFKAISRIVFFRFGEINKSLFWVFSKKNFFNFFLVANYISKYIKKIKNLFFQEFFFENFLKKIFCTQLYPCPENVG